MFKRILKIFGICMAIFVVVVGAAVGIFALSGGFKTTIIDITKLYIDDKTKADKEIYTLSDVTTMINCDPFDATDKKLEVIVSDPLRVFDGDGNLVKEGILKNIPKTINAGEEFTLEVNKDAMGNNIGGVVTLVFRPADKDKIITDFTLKVVVDVAIPNNSLYFAGNDSDVFTTAGKSITMGISSAEQNVYLKSNLVNAFCLETSNGNLKKAHISYVYKNQSGQVIDEKSFNDLQYQPNYNASTKEYNYYYEVPVTPNTPGTIEVTAKMHRTSEIEQAYNVGYDGRSFDNMPLPSVNNNDAQMALDAYNAFINKYIEFFDKSQESYDFFKDYLTDDGKVKLPYAQVENSKKFVFQTCTSTITVTAVNLNGITSIETPKEYEVLSTRTFTLNQLINEFDLDVTLDQEDVANITAEKSNLFNTLNVNPYVYVERMDYLNYKDSLWTPYHYVWGVDMFTNGQPVLIDGDPSTPELECMTSEDITAFEGKGFLILLSSNDSAYMEYFTVTPGDDASNKTWTMNFNVPLKNNSVTNLNDVSKALFLEFKVTGRDLKNNKSIIKNTFSRVYIEYTEYSFYDDENAKINFPDGSIKKMAINHNLQNVSNAEFAEKINQQNVDIDLKNTVSNYDKVQYKSVMYFVEEKSNQTDGGPKVATIGKYNFKYMNASTTGVDDMVKLFGSTDNLTGERLLNSGTNQDPKYYVHAINASVDPVNVFAVVYLSDKDGNPIDVNGRKIKIDETNVGDPTTLVVFAITDVTESGIAKIYIDSFVENMNFYTESQLDEPLTETITTEEGEVVATFNTSGLIKRNNIDEYVDPATGAEFSEEKLEELQDLLTLKFLYRNQFTLYATNFELNSAGELSADEGYDMEKTIYLDIKDFNGKTIAQQPYIVNTLANKQIALNNMCEDFNDEYELNVKSTNSTPIQKTEIIRDDEGNVQKIEFTLVVEGKIGTNDDYIYIKAREDAKAINALGNGNDFVNWKVSKVKATEVDLLNVDPEYKLYSKYTSNYNTTNYQEFGTVNLGSSGLDWTKYYLYKDIDVAEKSIEDNIQFRITSNLGDFSDENATTLNLDIIDMSQAVYLGAGAGEDADSGNNSAEYFADIKQYKDKYLNDSNTVKISYLNPSGIYQLINSPMVFTHENDGYIHVGDKKYPIEESDINTVVINNKTYILNNKNQLVLEIGTYFPVIKDYKDKGNDIIVILGEEFTVEPRTISDKTRYFISNINEQTSYRKEFEIAKVDYNPHEYVNDGTRTPGAQPTALVKTKTAGKVTAATINFLKGGLELNNGLPIYKVDDNGNYKRADETDITKGYVACEANWKGTRYSKVGVKTYLMITFQGDAFEKPITKVIEYELVQEPIELKARDKVGNIVNVVETGIHDPNNPYFNISAGKTSKIKLVNQGNVTAVLDSAYDGDISVIGASFEVDFYKHCTFELDGAESGIKFVLADNTETTIINAGSIAGIEDLSIKVPSSYKEGSATMKIKYLYQDRVVEKVITLKINPDFDFELKENITVEDPETKEVYYMIYLNANTDYNIATELAKYFSSNSSDISLELVSDKNNISKINSNILEIGKSYAVVDRNASLESDNPAINRDYIEFDLTLNNGNGFIKIDKKLKIVINPTHTFDFRGLNGTPDILNGQCLLDTREFVKVYEGYSIDPNNLINLTEYYTELEKLFTIYDVNDNTKVYTSAVNVTPNSIYDRVQDLVLEYIVGDDTKIQVEFEVNVSGYEMYFSPKADMNMLPGETHLDYYDRIVYPDGREGAKNTTITSANLYLSANETRNVYDYFAVFTSDNNRDVELYVLLKNLSTNEYKSQLVAGDVGQYNIIVALMNNGEYIPLYNTEITVNVMLVETFCDENGYMLTHLEYSDLNGQGYNLKDLNISGNVDSVININKYYGYFYTNGGTASVDVLLKDTNGNIYDIDEDLIVMAESIVYDVCYRVDDNGLIYDTGFDFTISPEN